MDTTDEVGSEVVGKSIVSHRGPLVIKAIEEGAPTLTAAARLAGISPRTVTEWLARGRGDDDRPQTEEFVQFLAEFEAAQARFVMNRVNLIKQAGLDEKHWTANAWLLERMFPEDFAKRQAVHVTGEQNKTYAFQEPAIPEIEELEIEATVVDSKENDDPTL